ncbi:uncharacterized protein DUF3667 [Kordia periserrulae]|uniref:Uncharacterized protein DUF3667 n=2 Tax=Kordia periserrulae TaxID=701523 RepID=A0A2T6C3S6_9FLAO|nr:uncharacterized protein DUF3667 [Kordia periserrulae]
MRVLFHNTVMNYFSVDARFFRSFIPLLTRPGFLAKKFVSGKRLMYLHPAQFYLFTSIVFFFIFSISTQSARQQFESGLRSAFGKESVLIAETARIRDSLKKELQNNLLEADETDSIVIKKVTTFLEGNKKPNDSITKDSTLKKSMKSSKNSGIKGEFLGFNFNTSKLDSLYVAGASMDQKLKAIGYKESDGWFGKFIGKQLIKLREKHGDGISKVFMDTIPISMFFLIPIFAMLLKLFYRKRGRFAHHMVFSFYYFAFIFLASSIIILTNLIIDIPDWIDITLILSMLIYLYISLKHFYEQGYFKTFFKSFFLIFIYLLFVVPLSFVILSVVTFFVY